MERLAPQRPSGISRSALRTWGLLFLALDVISMSILQNFMLGMTGLDSQQLLALLESSPSAMTYATVSIVLQAIGACSVPIFAFLLAEGARNTRDFGKYFLRVLGLAAISELPYNLAVSGKWLDFSSRNPVFALVLALAMLWFYQRYNRKKAGDIGIRVLVTVAAFLWCTMLGIRYGGTLVAVTAVVWLLWSKPMVRNMAGAAVTLLASISSLFLMAGPMGFLVVHFYNGEKNDDNRLLNYLAYPLMLIAAVIVGNYLL